ncbi:MAG: helix-hairpin-helix domain-containing protein [Clostridium sp.]|uniref:helix-hairpin-helix domain-containing protein n=1 Tax=Clostridium sp. TaxID=1506 RepID=UPI00290F6D12|nr:helix-hairpin-helix domain-containing protein [Clostridium sp.]MDU5108803.1 helix-hairpin-helix domain-containing protein [Clostridium sp.]
MLEQIKEEIKKRLNARIIAIFVLGVVFLSSSLFLYYKNKSKVFKDEYMNNIYVESESENEAVNSSVNVSSSNVDTENQKKSLIIVEIKGEVKNPDVYEIEDGSIIRDLINLAGGLTDEANTDGINRAEKLRGNQLIVIPNKSDIASGNIINQNSSTINNSSVININTAPLEELKKITGVGDVKAQSIIDYRDKNGGFKSIEELKNIDGIGSKTFEKIKDQVGI